jgi:hypothetical protein
MFKKTLLKQNKVMNVTNTTVVRIKYVKFYLIRLMSPLFFVKIYVTLGGISPSNWHLQHFSALVVV